MGETFFLDEYQFLNLASCHNEINLIDTEKQQIFCHDVLSVLQLVVTTELHCSLHSVQNTLQDLKESDKNDIKISGIW